MADNSDIRITRTGDLDSVVAGFVRAIRRDGFAPFRCLASERHVAEVHGIVACMFSRNRTSINKAEIRKEC